jgi:hypothetical protein
MSRRVQRNRAERENEIPDAGEVEMRSASLPPSAGRQGKDGRHGSGGEAGERRVSGLLSPNTTFFSNRTAHAAPYLFREIQRSKLVIE